MLKPLWAFVHNALVHPLMGLLDLVTWGRWRARWLERLHDWTGVKAGWSQAAAYTVEGWLCPCATWVEGTERPCPECGSKLEDQW